MADADLDEIRRARLQQLRQQAGQQGGGGGGGGGSGASAGGDGDAEDQQREREREARSQMLNQILEPAAQDRLGRIRLVKESRATDVENRLFGLARSGQLRQKVTEEQLKDLLNAMSEAEEERKPERIVVSRRKGGGDDDDLDDLLEGL